MGVVSQDSVVFLQPIFIQEILAHGRLEIQQGITHTNQNTFWNLDDHL